MKQFGTAARRGMAAVNNAVDVTFQWERTEGMYVDMTAHPPTSGQIALFLRDQGSGSQGVRSMFELLASVLDDKDYDLIEDQLRDGLDVGVIVELVQYLTEEWSARPTSSPSDSPTSPTSTGSQSTVTQLPVAASTSSS
jgi:hypothetical protein